MRRAPTAAVAPVLAVVGLALALALPLALPRTAQAGDADQFYFTALRAPWGSLSKVSADQQGVHLRWDVVEGELPPDLSEFRLLRDGTTIAVLPARQVMSEADIRRVYEPADTTERAAQDRRLRELIRMLDESEPGVDVDISNYPAVLRQRLLGDRYFAHIAARIDINVARARHRAWLDLRPEPGPRRYELIGRSSGGIDARLGLATVDVAPPALDVPAAASSFEQIALARCDAPESTKDHFAVSLRWDHAGASQAERFERGLVVAGYDLWRSTAPSASAPPRDLRRLAAAQGHDASGRVEIPGLELVNDGLIRISGTPEDETRYEGWNSPFAQFLETRPDLEAAGLAPGDQRAYYLVARDLTGNYGETTGIVVTVPDLIPPPAPWSVRSLGDATADEVILSWDEVTLGAYYDSHRTGRSYCNLATAQSEKRLRFVPDGRSCEDGAQVEIDLDVNRYAIYRFDDPAAAARFVDTDGDGYADIDERDAAGPGSACDPSQPDPATSPLPRVAPQQIAASGFRSIRPDGRRVIEWSDKIPGNTPGEVFWYRIASVDAEGKRSRLTRPVRAFVADESVPDRAELEAVSVGTRVCHLEVQYLPAVDPFRPFAIDESSEGRATKARAICTGSGGPAFVPDTIETLDIEDLEGGERGAQMSIDVCARLVDECAGRASRVEFYDGGELLASAPFPTGTGFGKCPVRNAVLAEVCDGSDLQPLISGQPVRPAEGPVVSRGTASGCVLVLHELDGVPYRLGTICDGDPDLDLSTLALDPSQPVCVSIALSDEDADLTARRHIPCFVLAEPDPDPPIPIELRFTPASSDATALLSPPPQRSAGQIVEWFRRGGGDRQRIFVSHPADAAETGLITAGIDVGPEPIGVEWREEWCFRARSVAVGRDGDTQSRLSAWSRSVCNVRFPPGTDPLTYIPWPEVLLPPQNETGLQARYWQADRLPSVLLGIFVPPTGSCEPVLPQCDPEDDKANGEQGCIQTPGALKPSADCANFCDGVASGLRNQLRFVAYRQSRSAPGAVPGEFIQVTPLVDRAFCTSTRVPPFGELSDPLVQLVDVPSPDQWTGLKLIFVDRYPHIGDYEYRYQFVYFDGRGEIDSYRVSNWMLAGNSPP